MRSSRVLSGLAMMGALLVAILLPACGRAPTAPMGSGRYTLSGHVKLTGFLVNTEGAFTGTAVVGDADGVPVELLYGGQVLARTTTARGIYRFTGIAPGGYLARTRVIGMIGDTTEVLTVASFDLNVSDTLRLEASGDLYPVPNPLVDTTRILFRSPDSQSVVLRITDMSGNLVRPLAVDTVYSGLKEADWDGLDQAGQPASPGLYWVTFESGGDIRAQILFKQGARAYDRTMVRP